MAAMEETQSLPGQVLIGVAVNNARRMSADTEERLWNLIKI